MKKYASSLEINVVDNQSTRLLQNVVTDGIGVSQLAHSGQDQRLRHNIVFSASTGSKLWELGSLNLVPAIQNRSGSRLHENVTALSLAVH